MAALPVAYFVIRIYKTLISIKKHEEKKKRKKTQLGPKQRQSRRLGLFLSWLPSL